MDTKWVKLTSWHALRPNRYIAETYCGRPVPEGVAIQDTLPAEKSCETCLRIVARLQDDHAKAGE